MDINLDSKVLEKGVDFRILSFVLKNCSILNSDYDLSPMIEDVHQKLKNQFTIEKIKTAETVQKYRNFSWHFLKLDPTRNRPSGEALARRLLNSKKIPRINPFVDAYNLASAETFVSLSAYDLKTITPPISVQFATQGRKFLAIGGAEITLEGNELILVDANQEIITQYLYRDAEATKVTADTREIIVLVNTVNHITYMDSKNALERTKFYLLWMKERGFIDFVL
jgi:DNA/RNA-binding domain of Phe-tRNA-synthetase-like protein